MALHGGANNLMLEMAERSLHGSARRRTVERPHRRLVLDAAVLEIFRLDDFTIRENEGALDLVAQLADIAGPALVHQPVECRGCETARGPGMTARDLLEE